MKEMTRRLRRRPEVWVVTIGFVFHLAWEFAHSPLYDDHANGFGYLLRTRVHCTLGDVLILLSSFWLTSLVLHSTNWPVDRAVRGGVLFTLLGFAYTVWSEWFNTGLQTSWSYAPTMPTVFGIGLTPILQWLVLPPLVLFCVRRMLCPRSIPGETSD